MKIINKYYTQFTTAKEISLFRAVLFLCLTLLPFDVCNFMNGKAIANNDNLVEYNLSKDEPNIPAMSSDSIQKALWHVNITPAEEEQEQEEKDQLQELIDQINAMEFMFNTGGNDYEFTNENVETSESNTEFVLPEETKTQPKEQNLNDNNQQLKPISQQTINKLKKMLEKPEEVDNPYEIGNTLYFSNCIGEAAVFYEEALRRNQQDDMSASFEREWLLFQTGNCLRSIDMKLAGEYYGQLVTEYPDSPWADFAKIQNNLIKWYETEKPEDLISEYKR